MADRDGNGRFVKGNQAAKGSSGGPGRPPKKREERYQELLKEAVTYKQFKAIVKMVAGKAEGGDLAAAKLLFEYLLGKPPQHTMLTGADGGNVIIEYVNDWRRHSAD